MNKVKVYIAGPYTKGDVAINTRNNALMGTRLANLGYSPYVPLLTHLWHLIDPQPYEFWTTLDNEWVSACDVLLRMPGDSSGADAEVCLARSLGIPVVCSVEELLATFPPSQRVNHE